MLLLLTSTLLVIGTDTIPKPARAPDSAQQLPELKVEAAALTPLEAFHKELRDRVLRSGAPASALITRDELGRANTPFLLPLLKLRGLKSRWVSRTRKQTLICPHGTERPAVYLNGLLVDGADTPGAIRFARGALDTPYDLELMANEDVEAVEVYRSMGERPPEFQRTPAECVVAIWTRRGT